MHKPLTKLQKEQIDRRYREYFWPIKKIAKELHISDRRVSAYLGGKMVDTSNVSDKPNDKKDRKYKSIAEVSQSKNPSFADFIDAFAADASMSVSGFISELHKHFMADMEQILMGKKPNKEKVRAALDELFKGFVDAVSVLAMGALYAMPKRLKQTWIAHVNKEPIFRLAKDGNKNVG